MYIQEFCNVMLFFSKNVLCFIYYLLFCSSALDETQRTQENKKELFISSHLTISLCIEKLLCSIYICESILAQQNRKFPSYKYDTRQKKLHERFFIPLPTSNFFMSQSIFRFVQITKTKVKIPFDQSNCKLLSRSTNQIPDT